MDEIFEIRLKNCAFYAYHGLLDEEKELGQRFFVDVSVKMHKPKEIEDDILSASVDYGQIYQLVAHCVEKERFDLIETLAHVVGKRICAEFNKITSVIVTIRKPSAPVPGPLDYAEVVVETRP